MAKMTSDVTEIQSSFLSILELIVREPLTILFSLGAMFFFSYQLTFFVLFFIPLSGWIISRIGKSLKRTAKQEMEEFGAMNSHLDETLGGVRIIKAFNAAKQVRGNFEKTNLRHQQFTTKTFRKRDLSSPLNTCYILHYC